MIYNRSAQHSTAQHSTAQHSTGKDFTFFKHLNKALDFSRAFSYRNKTFIQKEKGAKE